MQTNWITIIVVFLLVSPLLIGLIRGLPRELDKLTYSIHSLCSSVLWLFSYGVTFWILSSFVKVNSLPDINQLQWVQQQLQASIFAWAIAVPILALLIYWLLKLIAWPIISLLTGSVHHVSRWTERLPQGLSRVTAVIINVPKAILQTLIFLLAVHIGLAYLPSSDLSKMAENSVVYDWTDQKVITPVLASAWSKELPVLGQQTQDWFHQISQEAAKYGPKDSKSFWTWQTRFDSNSEIDRTAKSIVRGARSDREKAYRLYKWIGENIKYDDNKALAIQSGNYRSLTYGAIPTFQTRTGICSDYSALMVAMGRAVGLEVKQELGQAVLPDGSGGAHAWNVVYLKDEHKQIPCDPTWEKSGNYFDNRDFYATHHPDKKAL
ncbi:transglutaminase-like domain-containing protein [Shimazuella sp. AN120528]|uniref:transglutaminase domain-containing protein n=1 Tax=Shimazuella soli TaxID=1892854 RepID=UPI001F0E6354|nr:transglutaminase-like domain-containing protein [Shimazuella soli]MCH5586498.1 transglutaminase-like domain-containing protein [Shimazuella soli]